MRSDFLKSTNERLAHFKKTEREILRSIRRTERIRQKIDGIKQDAKETIKKEIQYIKQVTGANGKQADDKDISKWAPRFSMAVLNGSSPMISVRKGRYRESKNPFISTHKVRVKRLDSPDHKNMDKRGSVLSQVETVKERKMKAKKSNPEKT